MTARVHKLAFALAALLLATPLFAQNAPPAERVVRMNGALPAAAGQQATVHFAIYDASEGGKLLWNETQIVAVDGAGQYTAFLGAMSADGMPLDVFAGGAPRWLAVEGPNGQLGARTLLAAVPYAVTAANAATLAGRPATDFLLTPAARRADAVAAGDTAAGATTPLVNSGSANFVGKFFNSVDLINSQLYDNGSGVGLGTTTPLDKMHVQFSNNAGSLTGYAVQNLSSGASAYSGMLFYDHTGTLRQFQGYNNSTGEYRINNIAASPSINFMTSSTSRFLIDSAGNVGVGQTSPSYKLDVLHGGSTGIRVKSSGSFSVLDIDAASGDAALRFANAGVNQWNIRNQPGTDNLQFFELGGGGERLIIENTTGYVWAGATSDATRLMVGPISSGEAFSGNLGVAGDGNALQGVAMFDRLNDDGTLVRFRRNGTTVGTIDVSGTTVSYNAFTGSHFARTDEAIERGMLVSLTGGNARYENHADSELIYGVVKSQRANDPAVLGAYLSRQNTTHAAESQTMNPHLVEAVGNGEMWVIDTGRNLDAGVYLLSSDVAGHAMVDPGTFPVSNIVARLAEPIDWSRVTDTVKGADGREHKRMLASVFFQGFVIDRTKDVEINSLKERIAALESMLKSLTTSVQQQR